MATILQQMQEAGFTSDSQKDWVIRQLAEWEDQVLAGQQPVLDADDLAMVRHEVMQPHEAFYPSEGMHKVEVLVNQDLTLKQAEDLKDLFYEAVEQFKTSHDLDLLANTDVVITG